MSAPSMVTRTGDSLVIRSVVSGNQLYVNNDATPSPITPQLQPECPEKDLPQCKVKRNYACNLCNYFTQNPRQHLHHLRDVHNEKVKIYECKDCLYASRHFQKLARHMRIVHDKDDNIVQSNSISDAVKEATLRRPRKRSRRPMDEMYEEDYGDAIIDDIIDELNQTPPSPPIENNNNQNQKTRSPNKLKCSLCPFTTRHQGHLTRHERQDHIKTKFFRCVKCSYVTHIKARFTKHVKYHSMPMIKCDLCDFRTPYKWNLDRHNKNHNGHGAFKCCACNFTADIKQSLTVHEMNHHVPPVGQAAAAGLGVGRRRNKVGASDSTAMMVSATPSNTDVENCNSDLFNNSCMSTTAVSSTNKHQMLNKSQQMQLDMLISNSNNNNNINNLSTIDNSQNKSSPPAKKKCRPIPNLIPIQNASINKLLHQQHQNQQLAKYTDQAVLSPINISQQDLNDLCAKSVNSSLRDFTSLFDDGSPSDVNRFNDVVEITAIKKDDNDPKEKLSPQTLALQKKNASFFDKLKEKLMTNALSASPAGSETGDSNSNVPIDNIICRGCGHVAKCLSEMAGHQKTCGKFNLPEDEQHVMSHFVSSTRCQYCRQRCKSSADLVLHMQKCQKIQQRSGEESLEDRIKQEPHPMENKVFVWNNIASNTGDEVKPEESETARDGGLDLSLVQPGSPEEPEEQIIHMPRQTHQQHAPSTKPITHGTDLDIAASNTNGGKRVFKCPHCSFWATTASRFHVHIVGHLNKKPFECSLCAYRSNWRWDITKHIRLKSVRDSAHERAKVLMTDETGRRNYSKYNKYLMQMKESQPLAGTVPGNTGGEGTNGINGIKNDNKLVPSISDNASEQLLFTKLPPGIKVTRTKICSNNDNSEPNNNESIIVQNDCFSNNVSFQDSNNSAIFSTSLSMATIQPQPKRSLWKCKKCNFRDADRQVLLHHVKDHYIQQRIDKLTSENKKLQVGVTTIVPVQSSDKLESDQQPEASDKDDDDSNIDENDNDECFVPNPLSNN